MTPRFQFQVNDIIASKNLPTDLIDKGFANGVRYRVRFSWMNDLKQAYFIQTERAQQMIQSADGIVNGYAMYFSVEAPKKG
jgi:hypothetical protein